MTSTPNTTPPPPRGGVFSPPHDPILIFILNLVCAGGVGYFLIGQRTKGIIAMVLFFAIAWPTCFAGSGIIAMAAAVDGYLQAKKLV